ncbi:MAG TPA: D-2-hydroxyacid dehydrogenase, partial [Alcanivorax sp.]|nr:D-2-hydroxyacid dehydrogenase [Alcanivorax sp.]
MHEPRVTVLLAEDEPALPGLDRLGGDITLREVRGDNGLAEALAETDILV